MFKTWFPAALRTDVALRMSFRTTSKKPEGINYLKDWKMNFNSLTVFEMSFKLASNQVKHFFLFEQIKKNFFFRGSFIHIDLNIWRHGSEKLCSEMRKRISTWFLFANCSLRKLYIRDSYHVNLKTRILFVILTRRNFFLILKALFPVDDWGKFHIFYEE